jgi:CRP-like cAMP-binding protein
MTAPHANFDYILQAVARHITLSEDEKDFFVSLLEYRKLKRRQMLLREGQVCAWSSFVQSGCLRGYTIDKNGFEHVLNFAPEGWWIADMYSFISQQPGVLNIEALEDTEVLLLSRDQQNALYKAVPKFERFFRILIENSLVASQQRLLNNLSLTAPERYLHFCRQFPSLVNRLPQKHLAAYLGITPEFFSKMRNELLRKA